MEVQVGPTDLGAPPALTRADMPQGGWTETASLIHVETDETIARIQAEVDRHTPKAVEDLAD